MSDYASLTRSDVLVLKSIIDAALAGSTVRFVRLGVDDQIISGVARHITDTTDVRDGDLVLNDGIADVHLPIREILAAADEGAFHAGLS